MADTNRKSTIPMNLQFFAEGGGEPQNAPQSNAQQPTQGTENNPPAQENGNSGGTDDMTVEALMAQMAELRAQNSKMKNDYDKLCTSEGNLRKQLRAKQTAEEQEAEAKAEQAEQQAQYVKGLERFQSVTLASERYLNMGMTPELAKATAAAEVDGEMDSVTSNLTKFMAERDKKKEEEIRQKYMDQMPLPQSGNNASIDYSQEFNKAMSDGDLQSAALAILRGSNLNTPT